jgi:nucleotide-binding universal stress UspA family protein
VVPHHTCDDILVSTDGSAGTGRVVDRAESLAREHWATVHGLHVVDTASRTGLPVEPSFEGVGEALREQGENALRQLKGRVEEVPVRTETREASPAVLSSLL